MTQFQNLPLSTEWTVPFGPTFFHLGVHNLPPDRCGKSSINSQTTQTCRTQPRSPISRHAARIADTLLVLNHPLWDEKGIGAELHRRTLTELLERHGKLDSCVRAEWIAFMGRKPANDRLGRAGTCPSSRAATAMAGSQTQFSTSAPPHLSRNLCRGAPRAPEPCSLYAAVSRTAAPARSAKHDGCRPGLPGKHRRTPPMERPRFLSRSTHRHDGAS